MEKLTKSVPPPQLTPFKVLSDDLLSDYVKSIPPMLTAEEERQIRQYLIEGDEKTRKSLIEGNFVNQDQIESDKRARQRLVEGNLRWVVKIAYRYDTTDRMNLIQAGNEGLMNAARKFDSTRGTRFITYATSDIREKMKRENDSSSRLRKSHDTNEKFRKLKRISEELFIELGLEPTASEIAEAADMSIEEVDKVFRYFQDVTSLDEKISEGSSSFRGDFIQDTNTKNEFSKVEDIGLLEHIQGILSPREYQVICMRYGLNGYKPHKLREIGEASQKKVTRSNINQIHQRALEKLSKRKVLQKFHQEYDYS